MSEENPFRTLGFHPRVFKNLHDAEIFQLVKSQYRALMQIHHPDVSKRRNSGILSSSLSLAFAKLNLDSDPQNFQYWKESFLKSDRTKSDKKEDRSSKELAEIREAKLQNNLIEYLQSIYLDDYPNVGDTSEESLRYHSIRDIRDGCAMVLSDTIKCAWLSKENIRVNASRNVFHEVDPTLFELEVSRDGLLVYRKLQAYPVLSKDSKPSPEKAWIRLDFRDVGTYWRTSPEKIRSVRARIVGAISPNHLKGIWDTGGSRAQRTIESGLTAEETSIIESAGYTTDQVRPFLWLLRPKFRTGDIIVSMAPTGNKFIFLGKFIMLADKTKSPR